MVALVAWKHYSPAGSRRKALPLVILGFDDFLAMYRELPPGRFGLHIQAKATQRLSVPTIYQGLRDWMRNHA